MELHGLSDWCAMFGGRFTDALPAAQRPEFIRRVERYAAPAPLHDGVWTADYRRLRVAALKLTPST